MENSKKARVFPWEGFKFRFFFFHWPFSTGLCLEPGHQGYCCLLRKTEVVKVKKRKNPLAGSETLLNPFWEFPVFSSFFYPGGGPNKKNPALCVLGRQKVGEKKNNQGRGKKKTF